MVQLEFQPLPASPADSGGQKRSTHPGREISNKRPWKRSKNAREKTRQTVGESIAREVRRLLGLTRMPLISTEGVNSPARVVWCLSDLAR